MYCGHELLKCFLSWHQKPNYGLGDLGPDSRSSLWHFTVMFLFFHFHVECVFAVQEFGIITLDVIAQLNNYPAVSLGCLWKLTLCRTLKGCVVNE